MRPIDLLARARRRRGLRVLSGAAATTVVVRGLGLASQSVAVSVFGAGALLDAFLIAQIIPNLVIAPYAGGIELGLGPIYARARVDGPEESASHRGALLRRVGQTGLVITVFLMAALPVLVRLSAPGAEPHVVAMARDLAWWVYPTVFLSCVSAGCSTILYASGNVHLPVVAQAVRPLSLIVAILLDRSVRSMAIGMLVGAAVELILNLAFVRRTEGSIGWRGVGPGHGDTCASPTRLLTASSAITQMSPAIDQVVVSSLGPGKLVIFAVASRFYDVGKAAFVVPNSRLAQNRLGLASRQPADLPRQAEFEVRRAIRVGLGAGLISAAAAPLAIWLLFRRGEFSSSDAMSSTTVAVILAAAMVPWAVASVLPRVMVLEGRTREYAMLSIAYVSLNAALDLVLVQIWGLYGVPIATMIAVGAFALVQRMRVGRGVTTAALPTADT